MAKYDSLSLREIKAAMRDAYAKMHEMSALYESYADGANALDELAENLRGATARMQAAWSGRAADSATQAMHGVVKYTHESRNSSAHMARVTQKLARSTAHHHDMVEGVPEEDTSMWASMQSNYMNPMMAMPDHSARVYRATQNQKKAAAEARALDHVSGQWEHEMKASDWPAKRPASASAPPRTLPTRPARQPATSTTVPAGPPGSTPPPATVPPTAPSTPGSTPGLVSTAPVGISTAPASFVGVPGAGAGIGYGSPAGGVSSGVGALGGAGAAAGLGAGLLAGGAGALGGRAGGFGAGSVEPGEGLREPGGGLREPAGGLREPAGKIGAYERETLRAGRPGGGFGAGEEMVGERGYLGTPMGGSRRQGDDEEHKLPGYLEDDGIWTVSEDGVPPVLGEDG